jgi:hypothetical protein
MMAEAVKGVAYFILEWEKVVGSKRRDEEKGRRG